MNAKRDGWFRNLLVKLKEQGWMIERTRSCHYKFISPGGQPVFTSGTPSDPKSGKNLRAHLKRLGAEV